MICMWHITVELRVWGREYKQENLRWLPRRPDIWGAVGRHGGKGIPGRCNNMQIPGVKRDKALYVGGVTDACSSSILNGRQSMVLG